MPLFISHFGSLHQEVYVNQPTAIKELTEGIERNIHEIQPTVFGNSFKKFGTTTLAFLD